MKQSDKWVKIRGKRYLITWSGRGYWSCAELDAIDEINMLDPQN